MSGVSAHNAEYDHMQVHRPHDGASECTCGNWVGPMTTLPLSDPRSFAAHIAVEVLTDHAYRLIKSAEPTVPDHNAEIDDAALQDEARRFGLPMHKCPGCGEVKFVGHGPLCGPCYDLRLPPGSHSTTGGPE